MFRLKLLPKSPLVTKAQTSEKYYFEDVHGDISNLNPMFYSFSSPPVCDILEEMFMVSSPKL
jgi:hypothetical protein